MTVGISNLTASWIDAGTIYTGLGLNVTAVGYNTASKVFKLAFNGNTIFSIDASGTVFAGNLTVANASVDVSKPWNVANAAFDKANSANVLAYNTGIGANNYAGVMANSVNAYINVSTTGANNYAGAMANSGNAYSTATYSTLTQFGSVFGVTNGAFGKANSATTIASAAFDRANLSNDIVFVSSAYDNANAAFNKANAANLLAYNTGIGSNGYTNSVGTASNNFAVVVGNSGNAYANLVGTSGNAYANLIGTSGNAYTNLVGTSGNAYANVSTTAANNYAGAMANSANAYAASISTGGLSGSNGYSNTVGTSANNYAGAMANSANAYMLSTTATDRTYTNTSVAAANNYAGSMANSVNVFTGTVYTAVNSAFGVVNSAFGVANASFAKANTALQNTTGTFAGSLTATGTITANSNVIINPQNGVSEGGELTLIGAPTYPNWTIDSYTSSLRQFNSGIGVQTVSFFNALGSANAVNILVDGTATINGMNVTPTISKLYGATNAAFTVANAAFTKANTVTGQVIASGSNVTFQQTAAPTGFTKVTTYNDYAMRIVSGSVANKTNGVAFTSAFASQTPSGSVSTSVSGSVGSTTLSVSQIPGHYHDVTISSFAGDLGFVATAGGGDGGWYDFGDAMCDADYHYNPTGTGVSAAYARATGGGGSHNHTFSGSASSTFTGSAINMAVNYVDFILATAN